LQKGEGNLGNRGGKVFYFGRSKGGNLWTREEDIP